VKLLDSFTVLLAALQFPFKAVRILDTKFRVDR